MAEHLEIIEGSKAASKRGQSDACINSDECKQARLKVKAEKYAALLPQIQSVVEDEPDQIANMANVAAMLHETFGFWWTGFYRVIDLKDSKGPKDPKDLKDFKDTRQLVLGPFQGPLACTRIRHGRGVCGTAWAKDETQVVPDVDQFPGHIACSSASKSEIVVPIHDKDGKVVAVLDIDSAELNTFDEVDRLWLEKIVCLL